MAHHERTKRGIVNGVGDIMDTKTLPFKNHDDNKAIAIPSIVLHDTSEDQPSSAKYGCISTDQ